MSPCQQPPHLLTPSLLHHRRPTPAAPQTGHLTCQLPPHLLTPSLPITAGRHLLHHQMAAQAHRASLAAAPLSVLQEMDPELASTLDRPSSHAARHNLSRTPPGQQSGLAHLHTRWVGTALLCCGVCWFQSQKQGQQLGQVPLHARCVETKLLCCGVQGWSSAGQQVRPANTNARQVGSGHAAVRSACDHSKGSSWAPAC